MICHLHCTRMFVSTERPSNNCSRPGWTREVMWPRMFSLVVLCCFLLLENPRPTNATVMSSTNTATTRTTTHTAEIQPYPRPQVNTTTTATLKGEMRDLSRRSNANQKRTSSPPRKRRRGYLFWNNKRVKPTVQPNRPPRENNDPGVTCFSTKTEAAAIGSMVLSSLLASVVDVECDPTRIGQVMDQYFRDDAILQLSNGTIAARGLNQVKEYFIGNANEARTGIFQLACSTYVSWTAKQALTSPTVVDEFVLGVNENCILPPIASTIDARDKNIGDTEERGRYFVMELFSGGNSDSLLAKISSRSSSLPKQCQRPQIYAVILQPTFDD